MSKVTEESLKGRFEKIAKDFVHETRTLSELLQDALAAKDEAASINRRDLVKIAEGFVTAIDTLARQRAGDITDYC